MFWGSLTCSYLWIAINALLMMILNIYGHIIIIGIGIPIITGLVKNLRDIRLQYLLLMNVDKMKADFDTVKQILTLQQMIKAAIANQAEDVVLIGLVNSHVLECANPDCSCKNEAILYDAATQKFSQRNGKILIFE